MRAHRPGRPEDLPYPDVLWAAGTVHTMLEAIRGGKYPSHSVSEGTVRYETGGGSWWELVRVAPGRAVLYGEDVDMSDGKWHSPPVDFLTGAPDWLPWETLVDLESGKELGFVYWWREPTGWERVPYPDDLTDDGISGVVREAVNRERLVSALEEEMPEGGDGEALLRHVEARTLTAARLAAAFAPDTVVGGAEGGATPGALPSLPGRNLAAGLDVARRAGVLTGSSPSELPPGSGPPADRRVERYSDRQHAALVLAAMREAEELPRPEPEPHPELRERLAARLRSLARHGDGRTVLLVQVAGGRVSGDRQHELSPRSVERDTFALIEEVCAAEAETHPERGRPLFLRAETTPDTLRIDTAYDSTPDWWPGEDPVPPTWLVGTLWHEMARRAPEWRPAWAELLPPDVRYDGPPDRWAHLLPPREAAS